MAIWNLLAAAAPSAISAVGQLFNKPKKSDYAADTGYMDKYIASMRGRQSSKEIYHMAMQPALRAIGQQQRKMQRQVGYGVERSGLTGSGIEAQQRLSAGQMGLQAIQRAGETATQAQATESRRLGQQVDAAEMQRGQMISAGEKAYERAQTQWRQGLLSTATQAVGAVAGAKFGEMAATQKLAAETAKAGTTAYEGSKAAGLTLGSEAEFLSAAKEAGYTDPAMYAESLKTAAKPGAAAFKTAAKAIDAIQKEGTQEQYLSTINEMTGGKYTSLAEVQKALPGFDWDVAAGKVKTGAAKTKLTGEIQGNVTNIINRFDVLTKVFGLPTVEAQSDETEVKGDTKSILRGADEKGGLTNAERNKVLDMTWKRIEDIPDKDLSAGTLQLHRLMGGEGEGVGVKATTKMSLYKQFETMISKIPTIQEAPTAPAKKEIAEQVVKKISTPPSSTKRMHPAESRAEAPVEKKTVYGDPTGKFSGDLGRELGAARRREGEKKAKAMNIALEKRHQKATEEMGKRKAKEEALKSLTYSNLQGKKYSGKLPSGESVEGWVQHVSGDKIHISWRDPSKPSAWDKKGELQRKTISKDDWYRLGFELLGQ